MIIIVIIALLWIVAMTAVNLQHDRKTNKDIEELRQALDELRKIKSNPFDEDIPPNVRIIYLQHRLSRLVFCRQCPWYLTKGTRDTQKEFQEETE